MKLLRKSDRVVVTPPMLVETPDLFAPLRERGLDVVINSGTYPMDESALVTCLGDAFAGVIGLDQLSAIVFECCPNLKIVARNGVGMDSVDMPAATRFGVIVTAPLGANSTSVAELAVGLLIAVARQIVPTHNRVQQGVWRRDIGMELAGKTLGIIGLGRIGKRVATRLQAFEMRVIANDIAPDLNFAVQHNIPFVSLDELLAQSDVVSLHVPLTPLTQGMLNASTIACMKSGAVLLNTARGPVIEAQALANALDSGHLAGAGLDVYTLEWQVDPIFLSRPNVVTTTHLGAYTRESLRRTTEAAVHSIIECLDGVKPAGLVNLEVWRDED